MIDLRMLASDSPVVEQIERQLGDTAEHEYASVAASDYDENFEQLEKDGWRLIGRTHFHGLLLERSKEKLEE